MPDAPPANPAPPVPPPKAHKPLLILVPPLPWLIPPLPFLYLFPPLRTRLPRLLAPCLIPWTLHPLMRYLPGPRGVDLAVIGLGMVAVIGLAGLALSWPLKKPISQAVDNWPKTRERVNDTLEGWSRDLGLQQDLHVERLLEALG